MSNKEKNKERFEQIKKEIREKYIQMDEKIAKKKKPIELNPEEEREMLHSAVWDLYKDIHGIRPRWMNIKEMSIEDLRETYEQLSKDSLEEIIEADAKKHFYLEQLEIAKRTPGAIISKNPEFEDYPYEYPDHYEFNIYIPEENSIKNNSLQSQLESLIKKTEKYENKNKKNKMKI